MTSILIAIAVVVALIVLAIRYYGLIPPASARARVVILISGGRVRVKRGVISPAAREHLQMLAEQFGIRRATIGITSARKVLFSMSVPAGARQPIRNVLLNL